ncbi:type II toxin-antitoxin system HicA family toxin [Nocardia sp. NPDC056064]|uniref:type II toxin-antitoxin system HicA family toxin n=1 Tax=Nocardia sp. NPDC056064 TaxID=3345701 RepID=UPI0035E267B5
MVSEQPTHKVVKELRTAGFTRTDAKGSHGWWTGPNGLSVSVPDGHRTISPGVYRKILKAIEDDRGKAATEEGAQE